ncbi:MAG: hypothetical protein KC561_13370, partial [Myxococcales bacterium]|nr:hypothetical protein [Myxococcales bacterium]
LLHASAAVEPMGARLVHFTEHEISIEAGLGARKRSIDVPIASLQGWLDDNPGRTRVGISSFFRGAASVVLEPRRNRLEANISFPEAAAKLIPSLEGPLFVEGVKAASKSESPLFGKPFLGDLFVAHFIELNQGRVLLREDEVARWAVSRDRTEKAALSLVYYRTYDVDPAPVAGLSRVVQYRFGDGSDAARALLLEQLHYSAVRKGMAFSVPNNGLILWTESPEDDDAVVELSRATKAAFADSAWPLSAQIHLFRGGVVSELSAPAEA